MRHLAILVPSLLAAMQAPGQVDRSITIPGRFDIFTTDELGNIYALRGDELELFDKRGASWLRNSVKTFGRITAIDAFYSLKPMVFSPEQGQLAVLDNTLSVQGSVMNLPRNGFPQVVLACMSVQNHFWFFDERDLSVIRVDRQLRPVANSGRLDQQLGFTPGPISMQEHENRVYLNDPDEGILVFDIFGTYVRTIPITGAKSFEVRERSLYFFGDGVLQVYDMRDLSVQALPITMEEELLDARVELGRVYLHTRQGIVIRDLPRAP